MHYIYGILVFNFKAKYTNSALIFARTISKQNGWQFQNVFKRASIVSSFAWQDNDVGQCKKPKTTQNAKWSFHIQKQAQVIQNAQCSGILPEECAETLEIEVNVPGDGGTSNAMIQWKQQIGNTLAIHSQPNAVPEQFNQRTR